jgi:hypothetical protein
MFDRMNILFTFARKKKIFCQAQGKNKAMAERQPALLCPELIEVKPCLKMENIILPRYVMSLSMNNRGVKYDENSNRIT